MPWCPIQQCLVGWALYDQGERRWNVAQGARVPPGQSEGGVEGQDTPNAACLRATIEICEGGLAIMARRSKPRLLLFLSQLDSLTTRDVKQGSVHVHMTVRFKCESTRISQSWYQERRRQPTDAGANRGWQPREDPGGSNSENISRDGRLRALAPLVLRPFHDGETCSKETNCLKQMKISPRTAVGSWFRMLVQGIPSWPSSVSSVR